MPFLASKECFWPVTASMTSEVKNKHANVIRLNICNKFIEVFFFVGCMVSQPNRLLQDSTTMSHINKMYGGIQRKSFQFSISCKKGHTLKQEII